MAGTNRNQDRIEEGPVVILVEPQLGENIGMVARAMANFGLIDLRLVNPRDGWPNAKAEATASGAGYVLERVQLFDTLAEAVADLTYLVATTARQRDGFKRVLGPVEACANMRVRDRADQATGMLFGRERFGLSNEEISLADDIVTFPVNPAYASLNIAQAVLLMAYEFLKTRGAEDDTLPFAGPDFAPAPRAELVGLFEQLEAALDARGYFRPPERKPAQTDNLRSVLSRPGFSVEEIRVLRGVISSLDRFSPALRKGEGSPGDDPRRRPANVDAEPSKEGDGG